MYIRRIFIIICNRKSGGVYTTQNFVILNSDSKNLKLTKFFTYTIK